MSEEIKCPCCETGVLSESGVYEICSVCGWEDDPIQSRDPDFAGGANKLSLRQAQKEWKNVKGEDR
ncbi:CPCC family cysteine-rich protein [Roseinatronobacter alkalisoli]|uniref:CPCC family cysteine-rich protein n=1 Tax=Roseinatronobacter alkalisoli TaxID=3028235 RepID=UPI003B6846E1